MPSWKLKAMNFCISMLKILLLKFDNMRTHYVLKDVMNSDNIDLRQVPFEIKKNFIFDDNIIKERIDFCKSCEFLTERNSCLRCGCKVRWKVRISTESCPIGKWKEKYEYMGKINGSLYTS